MGRRIDGFSLMGQSKVSALLFTLILQTTTPSYAPLRTCSAGETPKYHHGFAKPVDLACTSTMESEAAFRELLALRRLWDKREVGAEATASLFSDEIQQGIRALGLHYFVLPLGPNLHRAKRVDVDLARLARVAAQAVATIAAER